jgi:butyryl-CoA dehydrogenase
MVIPRFAPIIRAENRPANKSTNIHFRYKLFEVLEVETLTRRTRYAALSRETFTAALDTARAVAVEKFATHNRLPDEHKPQFDGQRVMVPAEEKEALDALRATGFLDAGNNCEWGGMQLPSVMSLACLSLFKSANIATASYAMLSMPNANVIERFGSAAQKRKYLQALFEGHAFAPWR